MLAKHSQTMYWSAKEKENKIQYSVSQVVWEARVEWEQHGVWNQKDLGSDSAPHSLFHVILRMLRNFNKWIWQFSSQRVTENKAWDSLTMNNNDAPVLRMYLSNFSSYISFPTEKHTATLPKMDKSSSLGETTQFLMGPVRWNHQQL